jgi:hypothetical protein
LAPAADIKINVRTAEAQLQAPGPGLAFQLETI